MLYIISVVLGIVAALIVGGKFSNFVNFKFRKGLLIIFGLLIQYAAQIATQRYSYKIINNALLINAVIYCLLFAGFWFNRKYLGINVIALGTGLNALVILLNKGRMPVSYEVLLKNDLQQAINMVKEGLDFKHMFIDEGAKLAFLADIIEPPGIFGYFMRVVSIGDLIIALGICIFIFEIFFGRSVLDLVLKRTTVK
ncbi:MAG: DUF5317 domain-containing protein [Firmicutes bacterium]|nr:DUF5317 domain-containing protein [Bacillota bacterium]